MCPAKGLQPRLVAEFLVYSKFQLKSRRMQLQNYKVYSREMTELESPSSETPFLLLLSLSRTPWSLSSLSEDLNLNELVSQICSISGMQTWKRTKHNACSLIKITLLPSSHRCLSPLSLFFVPCESSSQTRSDRIRYPSALLSTDSLAPACHIMDSLSTSFTFRSFHSWTTDPEPMLGSFNLISVAFR